MLCTLDLKDHFFALLFTLSNSHFSSLEILHSHQSLRKQIMAGALNPLSCKERKYTLYEKNQIR